MNFNEASYIQQKTFGIWGFERDEGKERYSYRVKHYYFFFSLFPVCCPWLPGYTKRRQYKVLICKILLLLFFFRFSFYLFQLLLRHLTTRELLLRAEQVTWLSVDHCVALSVSLFGHSRRFCVCDSAPSHLCVRVHNGGQTEPHTHTHTHTHTHVCRVSALHLPCWTALLSSIHS